MKNCTRPFGPHSNILMCVAPYCSGLPGGYHFGVWGGGGGSGTFLRESTILGNLKVEHFWVIFGREEVANIFIGGGGDLPLNSLQEAPTFK